jgi:hypothetical protein
MALLITEERYFVLYSLVLGVVAKSSGYEVEVITRCRDHEKIISSTGMWIIPMEMDRSGLSLLGLIREIMQLV